MTAPTCQIPPHIETVICHLSFCLAKMCSEHQQKYTSKNFRFSVKIIAGLFA